MEAAHIQGRKRGGRIRAATSSRDGRATTRPRSTAWHGRRCKHEAGIPSLSGQAPSGLDSPKPVGGVTMDEVTKTPTRKANGKAAAAVEAIGVDAMSNRRDGAALADAFRAGRGGNRRRSPHPAAIAFVAAVQRETDLAGALTPEVIATAANVCSSVLWAWPWSESDIRRMALSGKQTGENDDD